MTQSKDDDMSIGDITFDVTEGSLSPFTLNDDTTITIGGQSSSDYVYSTALSGTSPSYVLSDTVTIDGVSSEYNITWPLNNSIDIDEIERMCKEYPALEKTWRNFKATYDLVKQDWKGKQDGEDELPF
jgi:hypothetical protein